MRLEYHRFMYVIMGKTTFFQNEYDEMQANLINAQTVFFFVISFQRRKNIKTNQKL